MADPHFHDPLKALTLVGQEGLYPLAEIEAKLLDLVGREVKCISSRDWYQQTAQQCAGWSDWVWTTVHKKGFATRKRYFDLFIVCAKEGGRVGRGDAEFINQACESRLPVLLWDVQSPSSFAVVRRAVSVSGAKDWSTGWAVETCEARTAELNNANKAG